MSAVDAGSTRRVTAERMPDVAPERRRGSGYTMLAIAVVWLVLWVVLRGHQTRELGLQDTTGFHDWINGIRDWIQLHGDENWFLGGVLGGIGDFFNAVF
ncbi:MAG: glycine betaine/proline transport system permease protein, partial [Mycobacterium sp.]|nr:glycine betaine/proline transport system permease protein [Mycobacterium sp.]